MVVRYRNFWITLSAVRTRGDRPRPAKFRADYARRQLRFVVNEDNRFEPAPPPGAALGIHTYVQLLHGPTHEDRFAHGFTLIAFTNAFGEYEPRPMDVAEFLGLERQVQREAAEEIVREEFAIETNDQLIAREEPCPQERQDLRAQG